MKTWLVLGAALTLTASECQPPAGGNVTVLPSQPLVPSATTVTLSATVLGAGYHADDCDLNFRPTFTTRAAGRADLLLSFTPLPPQRLALQISRSGGAISVVAQGPGPGVMGSHNVDGATQYTIEVCDFGGPAIDPGPHAVTLRVTHP